MSGCWTISKSAEQPDHDEPQRHHRTEITADARGAAPLHHEQHEQDHHRQRNNDGIEERRRDLQTLDRAKHRNRRRDHPIAIEQRRAQQAACHDPPMEFCPRSRGAQRQCSQSKDAAFAAVVGAHDHADIFQGDDDEQRPGDQRQHAVDRRRRDSAQCDEALFNGVKRRRTDIAVNDTESTDDEILARLCMRPGAPVVCGRGLRHAHSREQTAPCLDLSLSHRNKARRVRSGAPPRQRYKPLVSL